MFSRRTRQQKDDSLRCSFCHKSQDVVGKLISSPSDYPRAYICNECIAVCGSILDEERADAAEPADSAARHPLLDHPLASELIARVEAWVRAESLGQDGLDELVRLRKTAKSMMAGR